MKKIILFSVVALINLAMASCTADGFSTDSSPSPVQNDSIGGPGHTHIPPPPKDPKL